MVIDNEGMVSLYVLETNLVTRTVQAPQSPSPHTSLAPVSPFALRY
jgi:hypothetical protein